MAMFTSLQIQQHVSLIWLKVLVANSAAGGGGYVEMAHEWAGPVTRGGGV